MAIGGSEAGVAAFHDEGHATGGRIVVVALVHVAERVDRLLEAVAVIIADDAGVRAVTVHPHREAADPDVTVVTAEPGDFLAVDRLLGPFAMVIGAADAEGPTGLVGELRAGVALIEVPLAVRAEGRAVQRVVVVAAVEAGQEHFALIHLRIEDAIAVGIGIDEQVRRLRDDDLAVDVGDAERRDQILLLGEDRDLVGLARAGRIFKDHDAVAFLASSGLAAVVDAFGDVHPAAFVEIDVGRIEDLRRGRPDRDLETFRHREEFGRDRRRAAVEIDRLVFLRTGREDRELHVGRARLTGADRAPVIDADLGAKRLRRTRELIGDERTRVRADAAGVFLAGDLERLTVVVLADAGCPARLGFLPLKLRQVDHRAVLEKDLRLDPIGPVTPVLADIGDQQVQLLGTLELSGEIDESLLILREQDGRFGHRLRFGGRHGGKTKKGQQGCDSLGGYGRHKG